MIACSPAFQRLPCLLHQRSRKELLLPALLKFAAHVDQFDLRQRPIHDAVVHLDARVLALHRVLPALQRRRRRAQHHHRACQFRAHHGNIACVVARRFLLLVALVVLFVDQDEPEIRCRREDRRSRSHHNRRIAAMDAAPLLGSLLRRKRGVQQRHALPERRVEQPSHLRCQPDLRHQQNRRLSAIERTLHRLSDTRPSFPILSRREAERDGIPQASRRSMPARQSAIR